MLTNAEIETAKRRTIYRFVPHHEHPDCIRLAYEWLDAQTKLNGAPKTWRPIKQIIERWAGRYVDQTDVEVAATLHAEIRGKYPNYGISMRLIRPNERRFDGIGEALIQLRYRDEYSKDLYAKQET